MGKKADKRGYGMFEVLSNTGFYYGAYGTIMSPRAAIRKPENCSPA